jgi:hypothetical protein
MQFSLVEEGLSHAAAGQADEQDGSAIVQQQRGESGQHQRQGIDAGEYGLGLAQGIQPGREGFYPGQRREQDFLVAPSVLGAAEGNGRRQGGVVVILAEATLQERGAVGPLDIGQVLQLEAFFGNVGEHEEQAGLVLLEVAGEGFETCRFAAEFALEFDAPGVPVMRRKDGTVEKENALGGHQVFILVMMS